MNKITISVAQMHIALGDPALNFARAMDWISQASAQGSSAILFPELWTTGYDLPNAYLYAKRNLEIIDEIQRTAKALNISIGGSYLLPHGEKIRNTFTWCSPSFAEAQQYSKTHLFRKLQEDAWLEAGDECISFREPWADCALAVCYDLRFPELFRSYALKGAHIIWLCAEWPSRRIQHWNILTSARAIENQLFLVAANAVGKIGDDFYGGLSKIVSPWGELLFEGSATNEELLTAEIDLSDISRARRSISSLMDRREDLYGLF